MMYNYNKGGSIENFRFVVIGRIARNAVSCCSLTSCAELGNGKWHFRGRKTVSVIDGVVSVLQKVVSVIDEVTSV